MDRYSLADAKARLSEVIDRVEAGESIDVTRHGKVVAKIVPLETPRKKVDVDALRRLAATLPIQKQDAGEFIRQMRDSERY